MSRLPTVGGDSGSWGTVLNDLLLASQVWKLNGAVSAAATSMVFDRAPAPLAAGAFLVIDPFSTNCEIRRVSSVSSTSVVVTVALSKAHSDGAQVFQLQTGLSVPLLLFGAAGDNSTDDAAAIQAAADDAGSKTYALWLDGMGRSYKIASPLCFSPGARLRSVTINASASFSPADTTNAMVMNMQGNIVSFTGTAATDKISASGTTISANAQTVVFKGSSLPGGITAGRRYFVVNYVSATDFQISTSSGGAAVDITSDGSGTMYSEVVSQNRLYLDDVYVNGQSVSGVNGIYVSLQQPCFWTGKVRVDGCPGFGARIIGQQADFNNLEFVSNGYGLQLGEPGAVAASCQFMYIKSLNIEQSTNAGLLLNGAQNNLIMGLHMETNTGATWVDGTGNSNYNNKFVNVQMSAGGHGASTVVCFDMGTVTTNPTSWAIEDFRVGNATVSDTGLIGVRDNYYGKTIYVWNDASGASMNRELRGAYAAQLSSSSTYTTECSGFTIWGLSGKEMRWGAPRDADPHIVLTSGSTQTAGAIKADGVQFYFGSGAPSNAVGNNGDFYFRSGTPGTANQRIYVKSAGSWTGVV